MKPPPPAHSGLQSQVKEGILFQLFTLLNSNVIISHCFSSARNKNQSLGSKILFGFQLKSALASSDIQRRICDVWKSSNENIRENEKWWKLKCVPLPPCRTPLDLVIMEHLWVGVVKRVSILTKGDDAYNRPCCPRMGAWQICPFLYKSISAFCAFLCLMMLCVHLRVCIDTQQAICLRPSFHGYYVNWPPDRWGCRGQIASYSI